LIFLPNIPSNNRALTALNVSANSIVDNADIKAPKKGLKIGELVNGNRVIKEIDSDGVIKILHLNGISAIARAISDMGAISSVNLLKNSIPVEQAQELVKIMQSKETLITLCGLSGNEATLDFSNQGLEPGDAVLIANDISDMRALIKLDISSNDIGAEQEMGLQRICVAGDIELAFDK
jgi:hypothetical protein